MSAPPPQQPPSSSDDSDLDADLERDYSSRDEGVIPYAIAPPPPSERRRTPSGMASAIVIAALIVVGGFLLQMVEPLAGWRHVSVTERRTKQDYAEVLRYLVEERYPDAERICVVQDNLNTHTAGALYETFPPKQARHILASLEFHNTPKHGSWLNQAEIEISIFERGCLSRPVPDTATLEHRVAALEAERNERHATIDWQFTNRQARVKLKKLYPVPTV